MDITTILHLAGEMCELDISDTIFAQFARQGEILGEPPRPNYTGKWRENYKPLLGFTRQFGRLPLDHEHHSGVHLGKWLRGQRRRLTRPETRRGQWGHERKLVKQIIDRFLGDHTAARRPETEHSLGLLMEFVQEHGRIPRPRERHKG